MRQARKRIIFVLLLVGFGLTLLWRQPEISNETDLVPNIEQYPVSYMTDVDIEQYDAEGLRSYILNAQGFYYFEKTDTQADLARLTVPVVTVFTKDDSPWDISSDKGIVEYGGELITLTGNVILEQKRIDGSFTKLTTDSLSIRPNEKYADSDKPVIIQEQAGETRAVGMRINLNTSIYELLAKVKSVYEAP